MFLSMIEYPPFFIVQPWCIIAATSPQNSHSPKSSKNYKNLSLIPTLDGDIASESREVSQTPQRLKVRSIINLGMYKDQIYFLGAV